MTHDEAMDCIRKLNSVGAMMLSAEERGFAEACKTAIELLKKQIPQRPSLETRTITAYYCPVCEGGITGEKGLCGNGWNMFCNHCGQALDWGNDDG